MYTIKNQKLTVSIKKRGAELCNITSVKHHKEFLWQADAKIWGSHAPNLFPNIGSMKDNSYVYKQQTYNMPKHGFVRHNDDLKILNHSDSSITFSLSSNESLYKLYPFLFEFQITYTLHNNILSVSHKVINKDKKEMYFCLGGHPAFNLDINKNNTLSDYYLEFENEETSESFLLNTDNGLLTNSTKPVIENGKQIRLNETIFNDDALIFKTLNSKKVSLVNKNQGPILSVKFEDFKSLGIWAKPNAPYVCIEPWLSFADKESTNKHIEDKEGIITLEADKTFKADYHIIINNTFLD